MQRPANQEPCWINGFQRCSDLLRRDRVEREEIRHAVGVGGEGATIELALSLSKGLPKGLSTNASSLAWAFDSSGGIVNGSYKSFSRRRRGASPSRSASHRGGCRPSSSGGLCP